MKTYQLGRSKEDVLRLFPEGSIKRVSLGGSEIAVFRKGETFFAFEKNCPHRGASLLSGRVNGLEEIICPLHGYRFDLYTGQVRSGSCGDLDVFEVNLTAEGLMIRV